VNSGRRIAWRSLDRKLPLLISALLFLAVAAIAAGAYASVRGVLVAAAGDRLTGSARQLAVLLERSAEQRRGELARVGAEAAVRRWLAAPEDAAAREAATAALAAVATQPETFAAEVRSAGGPSLTSYAAAASAEERALPAEAAPVAGIGPLRLHDGWLHYEIAVELPAGEGAPRGWLIARRRVTIGDRARDAARSVVGLMGAQTDLLIGNAAGEPWTNFSEVVPPPAKLRAGASAGAELMDAGRLAVAVPIAGTPWMVWLEAPVAVALAPLGPFLRQLGWVALVVIVAGAAAAHLVSRRITGPIDRLNVAAESLATGAATPELPTDRGDEIGRLARSFVTMREQVVAAQHELEGRVTERTEELRRALSRLEEAQSELVRQERLAMLGQLASSVGHELRNPLAVMTNAIFYLEMVLDGASDEVREYLGIVRHEIGLSEKIVSDLLDFARVKTPQRAAFDLAAMADEQLQRLGLPAGVRVERRFADELPRAHADPVQAGQVALNLIANAVQALGEGGGTIVLEGRPRDGEEIELVVRDDGPGVPSDLREKIFEPLFTTRARGIGLGLAVSRRLAESNEGRLVLLDEGPGAAFAFRLPAAREGEP
jgi:signal transduction histidine kinase